MRRLSPCRLLALVLLLATLAAPLARAEGPGTSHGRRGEPSFSLADLFGQAWRGLVSLWLDNGCIADPDGRCTAAPTTDNGCIADPSGRCTAAPATDNGCILDPDGRCR